jgi:hypothetical protein
VTVACLARSWSAWQGKLLDVQEFSLTRGDADEAKREAEEKEERRLRAAEAKTQLRIQRRLLLSALVSLDDWASNVRGAQEKLKGVATADRLSLVSVGAQAAAPACRAAAWLRMRRPVPRPGDVCTFSRCEGTRARTPRGHAAGHGGV